jgi:hypothetical protein
MINAGAAGSIAPATDAWETAYKEATSVKVGDSLSSCIW